MTEAIERKEITTTTKFIGDLIPSKFSGSMGARSSRRGDPEGARFRLTSLEGKVSRAE
jgi:hypothetical protein